MDIIYNDAISRTYKPVVDTKYHLHLWKLDLVDYYESQLSVIFLGLYFCIQFQTDT